RKIPYLLVVISILRVICRNAMIQTDAHPPWIDDGARAHFTESINGETRIIVRIGKIGVDLDDLPGPCRGAAAARKHFLDERHGFLRHVETPSKVLPYGIRPPAAIIASTAEAMGGKGNT